jgi:hypothetical protein
MVTSNATNRDHAPANPSGLRQSRTVSQESLRDQPDNDHDASPLSISDVDPRGNSSRPGYPVNMDPTSENPAIGSSARDQLPSSPNENTSLLRSFLGAREAIHEGPCNHGTFSPRLSSPAPTSRSLFGDDSDFHMDGSTQSQSPFNEGIIPGSSEERNWRRRLTSQMQSRKMSTSRVLAERHGVRDSTIM